MKKNRKLKIRKEKIASLSETKMSNVAGGKRGTLTFFVCKESTQNDFTCGLCTSLINCQEK